LNYPVLLLFFKQVIYFQSVDFLVKPNQDLELKSRLTVRAPFILQ